MEFAREVIARGKRIIPLLSKIVQNRDTWDIERAGWCATIHATFLLGAIGGEEVVPALIDALLFADDSGNDWVYEELPPIFGAIGPIAIEPLKKISLDTELDWHPRERAMSSLAAMTLRHPQWANEVFSLIGEIASDLQEDSETPIWAGHILLDFQRKEYEPLLVSMIDSGLAYGHFTKADIQRAFSKEADFFWYQRDWLDFYSEENIAERWERWEQERKTGEKSLLNVEGEEGKSIWSTDPQFLSVEGALKTLGSYASLVPKIRQAINEAEDQLSQPELEQQYAVAMELFDAIKKRDADVKQGRQEEARQQIVENLKRFPDDVWVRIKAADAVRAMRSLLDAEVFYRQSLAMAETEYDRHGVLERLIPLLEADGRIEQAQALEAEERQREQRKKEEAGCRG